MRLLLISTWFQLLWFIAVLGREHGVWVLSTFIGFTYIWSFKKQQLPVFACLIIVAFGIVIDGSNRVLGVLIFDSDNLPYWLILLWSGYAWYAFQLYPLVCGYSRFMVILMGAISGGLSYYAGFRLGAVNFGHDEILSLLWLVSEWGVVVWATLKVYDYGHNTEKMG